MTIPEWHIPQLPSYHHQTHAHGGRRSVFLPSRHDEFHIYIFPIQLLPDSIACRLYVITVLVETTIDLVIEGDILLRFHEADKLQPPQSSQLDNIATASKKMPVYLSVFALAQCVQLLKTSSRPLKSLAVFSSWVWH